MFSRLWPRFKFLKELQALHLDFVVGGGGGASEDQPIHLLLRLRKESKEMSAGPFIFFLGFRQVPFLLGILCTAGRSPELRS